jgi:nitroimidazol reductase NimA-like FMN-containing flavoprotein (pyridoxamine 5'-phosphate oxidase superfamily)
MKKLNEQEMADVLQNVKDGVLALTDSTRPYCIPFGYVYIKDAVYLSMFPAGRKWDYFQKIREVCFTVFYWNDSRTEWSSVVIDGEMEQVTDIETIEAVVKANIVKVGLDPVKYLEKRMDYYKKSMDNPKALKIFKINTRDMNGRRMHTMLGE